MGKFKNLDDAVAKTFPWKNKSSYCLNNGHVAKFGSVCGGVITNQEE